MFATGIVSFELKACNSSTLLAVRLPVQRNSCILEDTDVMSSNNEHATCDIHAAEDVKYAVLYNTLDGCVTTDHTVSQIWCIAST